MAAMTLKEPDNRPNRYRALLLAAGLCAMTWLGWVARDELVEAFGNVDVAVFLIAVLLGLLSTASYGVAFALIARKHSVDASHLELIGAFLISQPAKYVPGKVWSAAMQTAALSGRASLTVTALSNIELMILGVLHMSALGLGCALWNFDPWVAGAIWFAGLVTSVWLLALPSASWVSLMPARLRDSMRIQLVSRSPRSVRIPKLLYVTMACLVANFTSSWCMVASFGSNLTTIDQLLLLSALYLGFASSIFALPVPAGVGVREVAAVAIGMIVAPEIAPSLLAAAALVARLWQIAVDGGSMLAGAVLLGRNSQP